MKKRSIIGASILLLVIAAAAAAAWIVYTPSGTRLALMTLFRLLPLTIEAERVTGRLADELILDGLRMDWTDGEATVAEVRVRMRPLYLLAGSLAVDEMEVRRVRIDDRSPESEPPYDLEWQRAPRLLAAFGAHIRALRLEDVTYRKRDRDPVVIHGGRAEVTWGRGSIMTLGDFVLRLPDAKAEGRLEAGFLFPSFRADLTIRLAQAGPGFDALIMKADLPAGRDPEQIAGAVHLEALSGGQVRARVKGEIGLTRNEVRFRGIKWEDGEGRTLASAEGQVDVSKENLVAGASFRLGEVDWIPALSLTGTLEVAGSPDRYEGSIALQNHGEAWRSAQLSGNLSGNLEGIQVTRLTGRILDGTVEGALRGAWAGELSLTGSLQARGLNPARIHPEITGIVNVNVAGSVRWPKEGLPVARFNGELLKSFLRDRALTGAVDARWKAGMLRLERLFVRGAGFEARASGALAERMTWGVQVSDFSLLVPGSAGRLSASGWARYGGERLDGTASIRAGKLSLGGVRAASIEADAELGGGEPQSVEGHVIVNGFAWGPVQVETARMTGTGTTGDHAIRLLLESGEGRMEAALRGRHERAGWHGTLETLNGSDPAGPWGMQGPASLVVTRDKTSVSPVRIAGTGGELLDFSMELNGGAGRGFLSAGWQKLNLARLAFVLPHWQIRGQTEGHFRADFRDRKGAAVSSAAALAGSMKRGTHVVEVRQATAKLDWRESGMAAALEAELGSSGRLTARATSPEPPRPGLPDRGDFRISAGQLDAACLQPLLPEPFSLTGYLSGTATGRLLPRSHLDASGDVRLDRGVFSLKEKKGLVTVQAERAQLRWAWREKTLTGALDLELADHGSMQADFRLPVPARLPAVGDADGPVQIVARARMREKGLLSAVFPGLIQESRGRFDLDGTVSGTWAAPRIHGTAKVDQAGAYLRATGIQLSDVELEARFEDQAVYMTSFRARSGPGSIEGSGLLQLRKWEVHHIEANIAGDRFQVVRLPEMEMLASPSLSFAGAPKALKVRGSVVLPEILIRGTEKGAVTRPSKDVVRVGEGREKESSRSVPVDMEIRLVLGERAFVRAEGVDARLEGDVLLKAKSLDAIRAEGEIRLRDGTYSTTGVRLAITRGRIVFEGGPADKPNLDILALRTIEERPDQAGQSLGRFREVKAGVIVTGTPLAPVVRLYSEPAMPDADVLSYIVLGQRRSGDGSTSAVLGAAAEALLAGGGSDSTLSQLKRQFGPDTVDMKSAKVGSTTQSIVTVGKYLQPNLYLSYGRSLFNEDYYVTLRYTLSKRWEVESKAGAQTGANLYYRIEFD